MRQASFRDALRIGRVGEEFVARTLRGEDWFVLPAYDFGGEGDDKAPILLGPTSVLVVPDLLVFREGTGRWCEVKTYSRFVIFRKYGIEAHGIARRHYLDYMAVEDATGHPVWLVICECSTKTVLNARLARLATYPCMCPSCQRGNEQACKMTRGGMTFFDRSQFAVARWDWDDRLGQPPGSAGKPVDDGAEVSLGEEQIVRVAKATRQRFAPFPGEQGG